MAIRPVKRPRPSRVRSKPKASKQIGLSMREVASKMHPTVRRTMKMVRKRIITKNKRTNRLRILTNTHDVEGGRRIVRKHETLIWPIDPEYKGKLSAKGVKLKLQCDCSFWTYHCEVAFNAKGAADIVHSNGEHPSETNPSLYVYPCKHLAVALKTMATKNL